MKVSPPFTTLFRFLSRDVSLRSVILWGFALGVALLALSPRGPSADNKEAVFFITLVLGVLSTTALVYSPGGNTTASALGALPLMFMMHGLLTAIVLARGTSYPFRGGNFGEAINTSVVAVFVEWGVAVALGPPLARKRPAVPVWSAVVGAVFFLGVSVLPAVGYPAFQAGQQAGPVRTWRFIVSPRGWDQVQTALVDDVLVQVRVSKDIKTSVVYGWDIRNDHRWQTELPSKVAGKEKQWNPAIARAEDGTIRITEELWSGNTFSSGTGPYLVAFLDPGSGKVLRSSVEPKLDLSLRSSVNQWKVPPFDQGPISIKRGIGSSPCGSSRETATRTICSSCPDPVECYAVWSHK